MQTFAETNMQTSEYRLTQRPRPHTLDQRIARYERALAEMEQAGMNWTCGYRHLELELADLHAQQHAAEVASNVREG